MKDSGKRDVLGRASSLIALKAGQKIGQRKVVFYFLKRKMNTTDFLFVSGSK